MGAILHWLQESGKPDRGSPRRALSTWKKSSELRVFGAGMSDGCRRNASVCSPPRPPWQPINSSKAATMSSG